MGNTMKNLLRRCFHIGGLNDESEILTTPRCPLNGKIRLTGLAAGLCFVERLGRPFRKSPRVRQAPFV
ncbi:MAG: hypothetical protein EA377_03170 [Phycisphaerales bacterium]|nr:MAG: hypothetical protein EA377_03170 [Phycisphaerales bacterium]